MVHFGEFLVFFSSEISEKVEYLCFKVWCGRRALRGDERKEVCAQMSLIASYFSIQYPYIR